MKIKAKDLRKKNPRYNRHGTIDVEVEHPKHGWIPFTASPDDCEEHGREIYQELIEGKLGKIEPAIMPSKEELQKKQAEEDDMSKHNDYVREALPILLEAQAGKKDMKEFQSKMDEIESRYNRKEK